MTKRSFIGKGLRTQVPFELARSNLCGPMNVKARGGHEYFISLLYAYSRFGQVYLIHHKFDSLEKFREYKTKLRIN